MERWLCRAEIRFAVLGWIGGALTWRTFHRITHTPVELRTPVCLARSISCVLAAIGALGSNRAYEACAPRKGQIAYYVCARAYELNFKLNHDFHYPPRKEKKNLRRKSSVVTHIGPKRYVWRVHLIGDSNGTFVLLSISNERFVIRPCTR